MASLTLTLFGHPTLRQNGEVVELKSRKGWALIAYTVLSSNPVGRETIATLFWPEHEPTAARRNLRRLLHTLNQSPIAPFLTTDPETIQLDWQGIIDVTTFTQCVSEQDWETAVQQYTAELLEGLHIGDSNPFEDWLHEEREQLRRQMLQALTALATQQIKRNDITAVESTLRRHLALDPWNEERWRQLMTVLAQNGRSPQALAVYQECAQLLRHDLDLSPSSETETLFQSIRDGRFIDDNQSSSHQATPPSKALPHQRARQIMLATMQSEWIDHVLHSSLHGRPLIILQKSPQPTALAHPWSSHDRRYRQTSSPQIGQPTAIPIIDIFDHEGRAILILGEPGSGKTTTLLALAAELLQRAQTDPAHPIPVILPLSSWRGQSLAEWIQAELNEKYHLLPHITADWIINNQLIPLCDGLDELPAERQAAAVSAINSFRETHGLTPIAVCVRQADYETLPIQLNLNTAAEIRPLTAAQVDSFLGRRHDLRETLQQQPKLKHLTRSPLWLQLLTSLSGQLASEELVELGKNPNQLIGRYIEDMSQRPSSGRLAPNQLVHHLRWLAQKLTEQNQSIFLLDRLQPSWLESRKQILLYYFLSRLLGGFTLGTLWSFRDFGWLSLVIGIVFGLFVAGLDLAHHLWLGRLIPKPLADRDLPHLWHALIIGLGIALLNSAADWVALVNGLVFALFFGWRVPTYKAEADIRLVEKTTWSWKGAGRGLVWGLLLSIAVFFYNRSDLYGAGTSLLSFAVLFTSFGGLTGRTSASKTDPNQGMRLSRRNALFGGAIVGGAMLTVALVIEIGRGASLTIPFLVGFQYFAMAALWYGGLDLINHYTVRFILSRTGRLPWRTVSFLQQASQLRLLYRVANGYLFLHPLLRAYLLEESVIKTEL